MIKKQTGIARLRLLIFIVCLAVILGGSYLIWRNSQNTKTSSKTNNQTMPAADDTKNWFMYEPPGKEYKIRLADGWQLSRNGSDSNLFVFTSSEIDYNKGTKASVHQIDGLKAGCCGPFNLAVIAKAGAVSATLGQKQAGFKTKQGNNVDEYIFHETQKGKNMPQGATDYHYLVTKSSKTIDIHHIEGPGDPNNVKIVEEVIKTLEI